jgi:hypothetical protein
MNFLRRNFGCCWGKANVQQPQVPPQRPVADERTRPYVTSRRANRRFLNTLKGHRDVHRWRRTRLQRRNAIVEGDPDIPTVFTSPIPTAPPAHLVNSN